jgi:hypothetical protein
VSLPPDILVALVVQHPDPIVTIPAGINRCRRINLVRRITVSLSRVDGVALTGFSLTIEQTNFGANINYAPSENEWVKISSGTFSNILRQIPQSHSSIG